METGKILGIIGIMLMFIFAIVATKNFFSSTDGVNGGIVKDVKADAGNAQVVELSYKNYNYFPQIINLKYNVPAKIIVDTNKVKGCFASIVAPELGIRKFVRGSDNIISFIPNKKGTFIFSCAMGMGRGKIIVS